MTQLGSKANRASLLWLALCLSRCKSMSPYAFDGDVASGVLRIGAIGTGGGQVPCSLTLSLNTSPSERMWWWCHR